MALNRWPGRSNLAVCLLSIALLLLAFGSGCVSSPIDLSEVQTIPGGESVVFGRIKLVWNGNIRSFTSILGERPWSVVILPDGSSTGTQVYLSDEGAFFWHLPIGGYTIAGFDGLTPPPFSSRIKGRIFAHFNVVHHAAHYIGTLTLAFDGPRYHLLVEDEYEDAVRELARRFSGMTMDPQKGIMVMERQR